MLKCSGCDSKAIIQCGCKNLLFCKPCCVNHAEDHAIQGNEADFMNISLTPSQMRYALVTEEDAVSYWDEGSSNKNPSPELMDEEEKYSLTIHDVEEDVFPPHKFELRSIETYPNHEVKGEDDYPPLRYERQTYVPKFTFEKTSHLHHISEHIKSEEDCSPLPEVNIIVETKHKPPMPIIRISEDTNEYLTSSLDHFKNSVPSLKQINSKSCDDNHWRKKKLELLPQELPKGKKMLEDFFNLYIEGHKSSITHLQITRDDQYVISSSLDGTVRLWDLSNKKQESLMAKIQSGIKSFFLTEQDLLICAGSDDSLIHIWNIVTKSKIGTLSLHFGSATSCTATKNSEFLIIGFCDFTIQIWDLSRKKKKFVLKSHTKKVLCLQCTNDNRYLVSGSEDFTIRIWSLAKKKQLSMFNECSGPVTCLTISQDDQFLVCGSEDSCVRVWSLFELRFKGIFVGHRGQVNSVSITKHNQMVISGSIDKTVRVWTILGSQLAVLEGHKSSVTCVTVTGDHKFIVSGSEDKTIRVWDLLGDTEKIQDSSSEIKKIEPKGDWVLPGHIGNIESLVMSNDYKIAISLSEQDQTLRIWDLSQRKEELVFEYARICALALSENEKILAIGLSDFTVRVWNMYEKSLEWTFRGHKKTVKTVCIAPNNNFILSGSADWTIRFWNYTKRHLDGIFTGHTNEVTAICISKDSNWGISTSLDGTLRLWNIGHRKQECLLGSVNKGILAMSLTSDDQNAVLGIEDGTIRVWNLLDRKQEMVFLGHRDAVSSVFITEDDGFFMSGSLDKTMRIWDLQTRKPLAIRSSMKNSSILSLKSTGNSENVVTGDGDGKVRIWNLTGKQKNYPLNGHSGAVTSVVVTKDSQIVISGSNDGTVLLWKIAEKSKLIDLISFKDLIKSPQLYPEVEICLKKFFVI